MICFEIWEFLNLYVLLPVAASQLCPGQEIRCHARLALTVGALITVLPSRAFILIPYTPLKRLSLSLRTFYGMSDLLEITIAVRSKVHSAFHPFVVGKMRTSTGDKLCCVCNGIGVPPTPAVSCGRRRKLQ